MTLRLSHLLLITVFFCVLSVIFAVHAQEEIAQGTQEFVRAPDYDGATSFTEPRTKKVVNLRRVNRPHIQSIATLSFDSLSEKLNELKENTHDIDKKETIQHITIDDISHPIVKTQQTGPVAIETDKDIILDLEKQKIKKAETKDDIKAESGQHDQKKEDKDDKEEEDSSSSSSSSTQEPEKKQSKPESVQKKHVESITSEQAQTTPITPN
jgi:hypothetical protein